MASNDGKVKIRLTSYDQTAVDESAKNCKKILMESGVEVSGPIPLPTCIEIYTILRSPHRHKDSREQFERRIYKRIILCKKVSAQALSNLNGFKLPSSVECTLVLNSSLMGGNSRNYQARKPQINKAKTN